MHSKHRNIVKHPQLKNNFSAENNSSLQEDFYFVFNCEMLTLHSGIVIIMCHLFIFFFFNAMDISGHLGSLRDTFFAPSCCASAH